MNINVETVESMMIIPIIIFCYCVGFVLKKSLPWGKEWMIPVLLFFVGIALGFWILGINPDGLISGAVSGLAAVGLDQNFKQPIKSRRLGSDEMFAMGPGTDEEETSETTIDGYEGNAGETTEEDENEEVTKDVTE